MSEDRDRLCVELSRLDWARNLEEPILREIVASAELAALQPGQVAIEREAVVDRVFFILSGCLEATLFDQIGKQVRHDSFRRGTVLGLFSLLLEEPSQIHVEATEASTVLSLCFEELLRLSSQHREFQLAMFRLAAGAVKHLVMVDRDLPKPAVVGIIHESEASRALTQKLASRLVSLEELICVAGDEARWQPSSDIPYRQIFEHGAPVDSERIRQMLQEWRTRGRLLIDVRADHAFESLQRVANYSDILLWCLRPQDAENAARRLRDLEQALPGVSAKLCLVWLLDYAEPAPPFMQELTQRAARAFKVYHGQPSPHQGQLLQRGLERIVHYLRGVQIGMALGGGAARGMAHLGVLKSLEQHNIYPDMLAGTSAGAMVGGVYAVGLGPVHATSCFKSDLLPNWFFRQLPGGGYWYLLHKYRRHLFGPMLRKYTGQLQMEQLVIPTTMVSVDLCDGTLLASDTGDATNNILQSINLPPLSLPIVTSGRAIVDGGLLNNVPADVLTAKGCNFVIASTVTAKLEQDFMGVRSQQKAKGPRGLIASVQVIMRQNMIQSYSMNAVGVKPADFVIAPDVTAFDISEFTRADEMAAIGEAATESTVGQLKAMLSKLDPRLFPT